MQPQPRVYLSSLRRELQSLSSSLDPAAASGLNYCVDQMVAQLITRDEEAESLVATLENVLRSAAVEAGVALAHIEKGSPIERRSALLNALEQAWSALPPGSAPRKLLETEASRADDAFRKLFSELSARISEQLKAAVDTAGWSLSADRVEAALPQLLPRWAGVKVKQLKPLAGLHAKEIYFLDLTLASGETESLVVRCDRPVDLTRVSVTNEFPLLRALYDRGFAIPEPLVVIKNKSVLGQPALLMRRVGGSEKSLETLKHAEKTVAQAAQFLARLHTTPIEGTGLVDTVGSDGVAGMWRRRITTQYEWWREMAAEPAPIMWRAKRWLEDNVHLASDVATVVHGDFSLRNLLLNEDDSLSSVLDWELAHVGHPAEDLGYMRLTVESTMPWQRFDAMYREAGGGVVTREQISYFDVWGLYRNLAINATVQNFFLNGKTTDYFLGTAAITYYPGLLSLLTEAVELVDVG